MKLKTQLDVIKYSLWVQIFSARWRPGGAGPPNVKLNLKIPLDVVNYPLWVKKMIILYDTT